MAISINWATKVITVPRADLSNLGGGIYELDVDAFRLELKDIEDSEAGQVFPATHRHNTQVTLSGVTYARTFEVINGYTVEFEDVGSSYTVKCSGANHNLADVKVVNQVSLLIGNSAGLISVQTGTSPADLWGALLADNNDPGTFGERVQKLLTSAKFLALSSSRGS